MKRIRGSHKDIHSRISSLHCRARARGFRISVRYLRSAGVYRVALAGPSTRVNLDLVDAERFLAGQPLLSGRRS